MKDLQLIENSNDLELLNFDLQLNSDLSLYVSQKLRIKLSTFRGEWYLNTSAGLPYYEDILIKAPNLDFVADLFKAEIISIDEINEITSFELDLLSNRKLQVTFTAILTDSSEITFSEVI